MRFKALMVDVDGVLIRHPDPQGWSIDLERDLGISPQALHETFFTPHWADIVHGRADLRARLAPVLSDLAPDVSAESLIRYWFEHDAHLDRDLLAQLAAFRRKDLELHLATVQEHERARYLWQVLGLSHHFDAMHYAAELGHAKPADGFFAEIETRTGFSPDELFFIDDKAENVDAARARGWNGAVWTGQDRLVDLAL